MKKIGFVMFDSNESDFENYLSFVGKAIEEKYFNCAVAYCWFEKDLSGKKFNNRLELCENLIGLCEKSDTIMVLPSQKPDNYLSSIEKILSFGKETYIDKSFIKDNETEGKIYSFMENRKNKLI